MDKSCFLGDDDLYRILAESSQDCIYLIDREYHIRYVNAFGAAFLAAPPEEIRGRHLRELFPPQAYELQSRALQRVFDSGEPVSTEENLSFADRDLWLETRLIPVKDNSGAVSIVMGVSRDITGRKRTEEALRESETRFRTLFSTMAEGVAVHDIIYDEQGNASDYVIVDVNPAFERHTGIKNDLAKGKKASELYGTGTPPFIDIYKKVAETGEAHEFVSYFEPLKRYFSISVFSPGRGRFATVFDDITESKEHEEKQEKLLGELKDAQGKVRTLSGMLPICAYCKKIRDDNGYWNQLETYIRDHSEAEFTHSYCPDCAKKIYPPFFSK